jgi:hypothetical protein
VASYESKTIWYAYALSRRNYKNEIFFNGIIKHYTKFDILELQTANQYGKNAIEVISSPVTGLEWPRGFQEVKVPKFLDNGTGWW